MSARTMFQLWLHPCHGHVSPTPLQLNDLREATTLDSRFSILSRQARKSAGTPLELSNREHPHLSLVIEQGSLLAQDANGKVVVALPIMCSQISTSWDHCSYRHRPHNATVGVIAYASKSRVLQAPPHSMLEDDEDDCCDAWLLVVTTYRNNDVPLGMQTPIDTLREAMSVLGRLGAICDSFHGVDFSEASWAYSEIGRGAAGVVALARRRLPNRDSSLASDSSAILNMRENAEHAYAVKVWKTRLTNKAVFSEMSFLLQAQGHPKVSRLLGVFHSKTWRGKSELLMLMESYPGGDLSELLRFGTPPEHKALGFTEDMLQALVHIHALGIVHRDLKLENVLVNADGKAVLIDFGNAVHISDTRSLMKKVGTPGFIAPEMLMGLGCVKKSDVFSCGVVMYSLLSGSMPFQRIDQAATLRANAKGHARFPDDLFSHVCGASQSLAAGLLKPRVRLRYSAEQALRKLASHIADDANTIPRIPMYESEGASACVHSSQTPRPTIREGDAMARNRSECPASLVIQAPDLEIRSHGALSHVELVPSSCCDISSSNEIDYSKEFRSESKLSAAVSCAWKIVPPKHKRKSGSYARKLFRGRATFMSRPRYVQVES
eukprot:TRINITY_DN23186_c0_g2_i1.p1 TRINITY_DN23186_c0_g2~~TRINITY_DN23186_c0_g2_i1.p1  ORF type:complete len:607 (-),score=48.89 TRINITY_DN23186_c0_g2_i1:172-1992(-)